MTINELLKNTPADTFRTVEKRPGIQQLIAPLFYEDGDMMSIYLDQPENGLVRICDHGMSLMRLSYLFDIETDNKRKILDAFISRHGASIDEGNIQLVVSEENLFTGIMNFSQLVGEITNMDVLSREMIKSMFLENLKEKMDRIAFDRDIKYIPDYVPESCPGVCVDYAFLGNNVARPIFLYGIKTTEKAQQATIDCLRLQLDHVPHKSVSVFENIDAISKRSRDSLINACGKIFSDFASFDIHGADYIEYELQVS